MDLLAVQGNLKSLHQHHSSKASILRRSAFREDNGNPLQYSCLENPMDGGAWQAAVHGVTEGQTRLSNFTFTFMHWRRKWQPTPVFLPGESQGRGAWWAAVSGVAQSRTRLSDLTFTFMHWRRKCQPSPVFLPGEFQGRGSLVGCRLWGRTESNTTEATQQQQLQQQQRRRRRHS